MGPEEYHYIDKFRNDYFRDMREVRISSLYWVWDNLHSKGGKIRATTVVSLIPYTSLVKLLSDLEESERFEDCKVVWDLMQLYDKNEQNGEFKKLF